MATLKIRYLIFLFLLKINLSCQSAESKEFLPETLLLLQCEQHCRKSYRTCAAPPLTCGSCGKDAIGRDGICYPKLPDFEIDKLADHASRQRNQENNPVLEAEPPRSGHPQSYNVHHDAHADYREKVEAAYRAVTKLPSEQPPATPAPTVPPHPTPAKQMKGDDSKHSPAAESASMADVYFLAPQVKRLDVRDAEDPPPASDAKISASSDVAADSGPDQEPIAEDSSDTWQTIVLIAVVAGCSVAGIVGLVVAGVCWYKLQKNVKAASEADYPAYGVTGPTKERAGSPGDRKLAHSAQMYHYQHQKQQMIAMERANGDMNKDEEEESDVENEEGDYTVYECPGLAPTGEMEVKNPLFNEDTPVTPSGGEVKPDSK